MGPRWDAAVGGFADRGTFNVMGLMRRSTGARLPGRLRRYRQQQHHPRLLPDDRRRRHHRLRQHPHRRRCAPSLANRQQPAQHRQPHLRHERRHRCDPLDRQRRHRHHLTVFPTHGMGHRHRVNVPIRVSVVVGGTGVAVQPSEAAFRLLLV
jgi:hypothetical protein